VRVGEAYGGPRSADAPQRHYFGDRICTDLNPLCYNSVTGQGQLPGLVLACTTVWTAV
jgi:hypothetical protein